MSETEICGDSISSKKKKIYRRSRTAQTVIELGSEQHAEGQQERSDLDVATSLPEVSMKNEPQQTCYVKT